MGHEGSVPQPQPSRWPSQTQTTQFTATEIEATIGIFAARHSLMDYNYYAAANQQPYHQFIGLPPTPSHTNGISGDEFNNESPPTVYEQPKIEQFQTFDAYNHYNSSGFPAPPTPQSQHIPSGPSSSIIGAVDGTEFTTNGEPRQGSNSDDEDMSPAQARRKAQNRAAQRAFRERKEQKVKELEAQVAALKQSESTMASDLEAMKASLQRATTENEILKATTSSRSPPPLEETGPYHYTPKDQGRFFDDVLAPHDNKTLSHRITHDVDGGRFLAAASAWDFIMEHELVMSGRVDMVMVSDLLKTQAKCDGMGPVFAENAILQAIEQSAGGGSGDLL